MRINTNQLFNLAYNSTSIKSLEGHFFYNYCFTYLYKYRKSAKNAQINIMIVNAPCNGFGDIIFAAKIYDYLNSWYPKCNIKIATTQPKAFTTIGFDSKILIDLQAGNRTQCRRFARLSVPNNIMDPDIYLVAPVMTDFAPDIKDLKQLFPTANWWNTYFFSEYNDVLSKNFTFNTGIGNDRDGLLFTNTESTPERLVKGPYTLAYVAESIGGVGTCLLSFFLMVATKYHNKYKELNIIVPPWFANHTDRFKNIKQKIKHLYPNIIVQSRSDQAEGGGSQAEGGGSQIVISKGAPNDPVLIFRADILPVPNKSMISLMQHSLKDILLTGDQSITDALSCCPKKNIFYQIAPWKADFAENLAKLLPNMYLRSVRTSCGTLKALSYNSNYKKFIKNWDFRTRSKQKMDIVVLIGMILKNNQDVSLLSEIIASSRSIRTLRSQLDQNFEK